MGARVTGRADGDGAARRVDLEGAASCGGGAGVRYWWCDGPGGAEGRGAVVRAASGAAGDWGTAGGVIGGGALGDVDGLVPQVMDRVTLVMAVVSGRWRCWRRRCRGVLHGTQRMVAVGYAPGGGGAGGVVGEGAAER